MTQRYLVYALFGFALGCSENDSNTNTKIEQVLESAYDTQIQAIDKANALEQQVQDMADKKRAEIEEQGG